MKKTLLLSLVFALSLCLWAAAAGPQVGFGVMDVPTGQEAVFGLDFSDVGSGHWAYEAVKKGAEMGITAGRGDGSFGPNDQVTRAEAVTMLHRMAGEPKAMDEAEFTDVKAQYKAAVDWAAEMGVINGISETQFGPEITLTRAQLVTMLFRLDGGVSGKEAMFTSLYDAQFADSGEIADWAKRAMYWGVYKELIRGTAVDMLSPQRVVTRAEATAILVRYAGN